MFRVSAILLCALPLAGQCRLPELAPNPLDHMSPEQLVESGHFLRAEYALAPVVEKNPANLDAALLLSRADAALGEFDEALRLAEIVLRSDPSNPSYHVHTAAVLGVTARKASLLKQLTYAKRARQELDQAIALDPANIEAQWGLMMYYFAAPALIGGDKNKAQSIGKQMTSSEPGRADYYRGRLAAEMKDFDSAESSFRQAMAEDPLFYDAAAALAKLYLEQKPDVFRAGQWACAAVHLDPSRGDAWALLASAYSMSGCWTEALDAAQRSEAIAPDDLSPYYAIASSAIAQHRQRELAAECLRKYLSLPQEGNAPPAADAEALLGHLR